jgi:hypothetical protein
LELHRIKGGKDPIEGVMRRDTVGQVQEAGEPVSFGLPEQFDIVPALRAANDCADRHRNDTEQGMEFGTRWVSLYTWVI